MMREILFRGKRVYDGEWVEGNLFIPEKHGAPTQIMIGTNSYRIPYDVIPETVGQYTGLTDKNGKKIFEGDVLSHFINYHGRRINGVVAYDITLAAYMWEPKGLSSLFLTDVLSGNGAEIIGNIHDNPELLKGDKDNG